MLISDKDKTKDLLIEELEHMRNDVQTLQYRINKMTEISAAIIYTLDKNGKFLFVSKAVESILHYSPAELIGKHFSYIMSPEEYEKVSSTFVLPRYSGKRTLPDETPKLFDERRTGGRRTKDMEVRLRMKTGDGYKVLVGDVTGIIALETIEMNNESDDNPDTIIGSQGIIFDVTKYKSAEKEKMELQRRLFETQKMDALGRLSGKVAHDLNNKLGSILGCAEIIKQDFITPDNEIKLYVDTIISASRHATELSNRLMEFSQTDDQDMTEVNLHELIRNVIELVLPTISAQISMQTSFGAKDDWIVGNSSQLQNAILNILSNSCDAFGAKGGIIFFETRNVDVDKDFFSNTCGIPAGKYVKLKIIDNGSGMTETTRSQIFRPFFTTKAIGKGIGLGLASVRDCIKIHGGLIEAESKEGQGTIIKIYLPVTQAPQQSQYSFL
jgi:PAS domain S-box-containing protein